MRKTPMDVSFRLIQKREQSDEVIIKRVQVINCIGVKRKSEKGLGFLK